MHRRDLVEEVPAPVSEEPAGKPSADVPEPAREPLKLEVGKWYKDRNGGVRGPMTRSCNDQYPFTASGLTWAADGRYYVNNPTGHDLIEEVPAPRPSEPPSPSEPRWLRRVRREHAVLNTRILRLAAFQMGDEFDGLPPEQRAWMKVQLCGMSVYREALKQRIVLAEKARGE